MNARLTFTLAVLAVVVFAVWGCNEALDSESVDPPSELTGQAILQNQDNHYGIKVNLGIGAADEVTLITDESGQFTIPFELNAGTWELRAEYPFFSDQTTSFEVKNGLPVSDLEELILPQQITFQVITDKMVYERGETIKITLLVSNVSDEDVVLISETSPMLAAAVVQDGVVLWGSLYPGDIKGPEEITIPAGDVQDFVVEWPTESTAMEPGYYRCYAVLAASATYPDYFGSDSAELNRTLLDKLVPAEIELQ